MASSMVGECFKQGNNLMMIASRYESHCRDARSPEKNTNYELHS